MPGNPWLKAYRPFVHEYLRAFTNIYESEENQEFRTFTHIYEHFAGGDNLWGARDWWHKSSNAMPQPRRPPKTTPRTVPLLIPTRGLPGTLSPGVGGPEATKKLVYFKSASISRLLHQMPFSPQEHFSGLAGGWVGGSAKVPDTPLDSPSPEYH